MMRIGRTAIAITLVLAGSALAQQQSPAPPAAPPPVDFSKVEIKTTDLGDNVYMLEGQGGNITVAVGKAGIIMVDGQFAPLHDKIKAAIATISSLPVKYLINTHYHGDHTGGNEAFAKDGAIVVSDVNVRNRLAEGTTNGLTGVKTPPAAAGALPSKTYAGKMLKVRLPGRVADLRHIANAHTDGDTYVWFKTANVLATGDTFTNGRYPNIDFANGGNIKGMIAATNAYIKLTNAKSRIVPGHGPIADKTMLTEYRAMLVTARDRMAALVKQGKSEDDVVAARPFADLDKKWAPTELASKNFIRVVYHSLADKTDKKALAEANAAPGLREHERAHDNSRKDCRATDRAETDDRSCGIFDRRPDLGSAAVGARRIGLFPRRRRGLYPRCATAADGYSRRGDEGHPLGIGTLRESAGRPGPPALLDRLGLVGNRRDRTDRQPLRRRRRS